MSIRFELLHTDGAARGGRLHTPHGIVETPVFMAVGTQGTVKGLTPQQLDDAGVPIILGNTYHLALRPGDDLIAEQGGLHRFMNWSRPILTDSGGFQVYSLAQSRQITDQSAVFRSHIDGALLELTPERSIRIQENLGSDIAMCLDECPPADTPPEYLRSAVRRTLLWAARCRAAHRRTDQALFAIIQGGTDLDLRARCADALTPLDFAGYALGGFCVGETAAQMVAAL
jgi:queuine tRNA-ribosyltransferase